MTEVRSVPSLMHRDAIDDMEASPLENRLQKNRAKQDLDSPASSVLSSFSTVMGSSDLGRKVLVSELDG